MIVKTQDGTTLKVALSERLDTVSAPEFEALVVNQLGGITDLVIDVAELQYISSAGLRALLAAAKTMKAKRGTCVIVNASQSVLDIFEMTGFDQILDIR